MMLYNNAAGLVTATTAPSPLKGAGMTTQAQGQQWVAELAGGSEIVLDLNNGTRRFAVAPNNLTAGAMSVFTEWNPTNEAYIKPEISAPGGNILSTVPRNMGAYDVLSGTSMATPFVAGVIGLMLESRSDLKADAIRAILANAGTPVNFNDGTTTYDFLAPVVQQGGGLINAYEAVHTSTVVDVANLAFNDTDHFVSENKFTITNRGSSSITYSLSYVNAPAAYALADDANPVPAPFPPEMVAQGATLDFGYSSSITVSAGQTVEINVAVTPPSGLDSKRIPVYTGFININGTNGDTLSLPYGGIASSLKSATILSQEYLGFPYLTSTADPNYNPVPEGTVFVLPKGNSTNTTTGYPDLLTELAMGSALIRADLIPESTSNATTTTILGVKTLGSIAGFPIPYRSRASAWEQPFTGLMSDDTYAPAGDYSILVRALKIFGDPDKAEDYDSASTQTFSIKYA